MRVKLLVDILFEYGGAKKTLFKAGSIHQVNRRCFSWEPNPFGSQSETDKLVGFWIGNQRSPDVKLVGGNKGTGALIETNVLLSECELVAKLISSLKENE